VTLENESLRSIARDLKFHHDPVGMWALPLLRLPNLTLDIALQSMVITKQQQIGGEGRLDLSLGELG
jgi:hypothetical protein